MKNTPESNQLPDNTSPRFIEDIIGDEGTRVRFGPETPKIFPIRPPGNKVINILKRMGESLIISQSDSTRPLRPLPDKDPIYTDFLHSREKQK